MARGWTCARCSNKNGEGTLNCARCALIRGGVVVEPNATAPGLGITPPPTPPEAGGVIAHGWGDGQGQAGVVISTPTPKGPAWRRIPIRLWIFGAFLVAGGISAAMTDAIRLPFGDFAKSGELSSGDLQVGDCWDYQGLRTGTFDTVIARPCAEEHELEAFHVEAMPTGEYPSDDAFLAFVQAQCVPSFAEYVGRSYDNSVLEISWIVPTSGSWTLSNRKVTCSIEDPENWRLVGSARGSNR